MTILIAARASSLTDEMAETLRGAGHTVTSAATVEGATQLALAGTFDVTIVDVTKQLWNGWAVLEQLKGHTESPPFLVVTDPCPVAEWAKGLELGAADFLLNPFDGLELLGRVYAIGHRTKRLGERIAVGGVVLDTETHRATRDGRALNLSPHEFRALLLLVRNSGQIVSRQAVANQVLERKALGRSNAVDVLIRRLRIKVDADYAPELIRTVRGQGYSFVPPSGPVIRPVAQGRKLDT